MDPLQIMGVLQDCLYVCSGSKGQYTQYHHTSCPISREYNKVSYYYMVHHQHIIIFTYDDG